MNHRKDISFRPNDQKIPGIATFAGVKRHFNTHTEGLDLRFWHDLIESRGELISLKKGDCLCRRGEPTKAFGYVKSGYLIYSISSPTHLGGFAFPGAMWGDFPNNIYGRSAFLDIIAGQKSEVWMMDGTLLPELFDVDPDIARQLRIFIEQAYSSLLHRYATFYAKSPTERYLELIHDHPQIEQDIPQKEIAEYLHISPITLCRIKKGLLYQ